ncbi:MAG: TonB family protein [Pyrinomonadaceae bacterium]|nr:TonB family protein [Pyrinomonadaceae bacterium]
MTCQNCGKELAPFVKFCQKCGTPASAAPPQPPTPQQYSPPAGQMQTSWGANPEFAPPKRKSRVGKVLLIIGIILILLATGVGLAVYFGFKSYERMVKSSAAYELAESTLKENAAVKERLGNIKSIGYPWGVYSEQADGTGNAAFTMAVEGDKASGRYVAALTRARSVWRVRSAQVNLDSGDVIVITDKTKDTGIYDPNESSENANVEPNSNQGNSNNNVPQPVPGTISGGVLNGKATSLPEPVYPPAAKAARAQGTVTVQVTVDEKGKVVSASAISGPPLLRASAVSAARQAEFSPTLLSGKPVKVTGILTYKFTYE